MEIFQDPQVVLSTFRYNFSNKELHFQRIYIQCPEP